MAIVNPKPDFQMFPPNYYYTPPIYNPPAYTPTPTVSYTAPAVGCCDTTWLYMLVAGLVGGIIGYAVNKQRKVK